MKYILYDLEIKNAIPDKSPIPGIEYCGGWNDHGNMGISVIGFCEILTGDDNPASLLESLREDRIRESREFYPPPTGGFSLFLP
jgi:hypothetical protein